MNKPKFNKPKFTNTLVFFFICVFFSFVALSWETRHRLKFKKAVSPGKLEDGELISALNDFQQLKNCTDPYIENFQEKQPLFKNLNRLWIINSSDYWINKFYRELKIRRVTYDMTPFSMEEQVQVVKNEIRSRIRKNGILYEMNSLLGGFFGVYLEVRSLEFFLAWARATEKPLIGPVLKMIFIWFSSYFTGIIVPCAGAAASEEQRPVILPYDHIYEMVKRAKIARVQPCSCKSFFLPEKGVPRDSCMGFEYIEDLNDLSVESYHEDFRMRDHVLQKLKECEEKGLVHQFMTVSRPTGKKGYVLCNCGESCIPIHLYLNYGIPMVRGCGQVAVVEEPQKCITCGRCRERCIFKAAELSGGTAVVHPKKCLGCGLCIKTCPEGIRVMQAGVPGQGDGLLPVMMSSSIQRQRIKIREKITGV